jgi:hypothetical protein
VIENRSSRIGILFALLSAVLFGASTPFAKLLLGSALPWMMAGLQHSLSWCRATDTHINVRDASQKSIRYLPSQFGLQRLEIMWSGFVQVSGDLAGSSCSLRIMTFSA